MQNPVCCILSYRAKPGRHEWPCAGCVLHMTTTHQKPRFKLWASSFDSNFNTAALAENLIGSASDKLLNTLIFNETRLR